MSGVASGITRVSRALRRYGVTGAIRRGAHAGRRLAAVRERHYWYARPIAEAPGAAPEGSGPFELRRAPAGDTQYLETLPTVEIEQATEFFDRGGALWVVLVDGSPAFACWTFRDATPLPVIQGGWQPLPPDVAGLAFSLTHPDFRGRGVAPWAWEAIAAELAREGVRRIVTEVEADNAASRRAVSKAGFAEVAATDVLRIGPYRRIETEVFDAAAAGFLRDGAS